jgi:transcriptional regulator GlxA family with amidase domain
MIDFTILALPGALASGVSASLDLLSNAAQLAAAEGSCPPRWRVVSSDPITTLSNGLMVPAEPLRANPVADQSIWIVPGLGVEAADAMAARFAAPDAIRAIAALRTQADAGATIAASCSGVFLLREAGLLAGRRVTTTWWLGGLLRQMEPRCTVDVNQMVIADGPIVTSGAAFAHVDLMLHLIAQRFGADLAGAVSRAMVVDGRRSQARFIDPAVLANGNELVERVVQHFEASFPRPPTVADLASEMCMSERTLSRHIKAATGRSISTLLQQVRINRARALLATSSLTIEQIAAQVGYADTTALRRLMWKVTRATPSQFRPTTRYSAMP